MTTLVRVTLYGLSLGILLSGPVKAEEGAPPASPADSTVISSPPASQLVPDIKSGRTALLLSLLGTVVPVAASAPFIWESSGTSLAKTSAVVCTGAILLGPSLGHFYAARPGRAFAGIGIRVLASAAVVVASLGGISEGGTTSGQATLGVIGGIVVGASVIYDIIEAPRSARVHNDGLHRGLTAIGISPSVDSRGVGLRANVSF